VTVPQAVAAQAFVRGYYAALNDMIAQVPGATSKPMYSAACTECAGDYANFVGIQRDGSKLTGSRFTLKSVDAIDVGPSPVIYVVASVTEAAGTLVSKTGRVLQAFPAQSGAIQTVLQPTGTSFLVVKIDAVG
jgi:hypothetical protein